MKPLFPIAVAMTLSIATAACAQNQQAVVAPFDRTSGPTVAMGPSSGDTRSQDQNTAVSPSTNNGTAKSSANDLGYGNWRTSNGLNSDPNNPSGAPGPSTITSGQGH